MNKHLYASAIFMVIASLPILAQAEVRDADEYMKDVREGRSGTSIEQYMAGNRDAISWACNEDSFSSMVNDKINAMIPQACEQLDTSTSLEGNPFAYENPNQSSCDLGLPGLPSWNGFDFSLSGPDMCEVVKTVVGDQVKQIGDQMGSVNDLINDNLSGSVGVDVGSALESVIGN